MPQLATIDLAYGPVIDITFCTTLDVLGSCDTAVLLLEHSSGLELAIRIERGTVVDAHLWDPRQRMRRRLSEASVSATEHRITCSIPLDLVPSSALSSKMVATLIINGAPAISGIPVSVRPALELAPSASDVMVSH